METVERRADGSTVVEDHSPAVTEPGGRIYVVRVARDRCATGGPAPRVRAEH